MFLGEKGNQREAFQQEAASLKNGSPLVLHSTSASCLEATKAQARGNVHVFDLTAGNMYIYRYNIYIYIYILYDDNNAVLCLYIIINYKCQQSLHQTYIKRIYKTRQKWLGDSGGPSSTTGKLQIAQLGSSGLMRLVAGGEQTHGVGPLCAGHQLGPYQYPLLWKSAGHDSDEILGRSIELLNLWYSNRFKQNNCDPSCLWPEIGSGPVHSRF